MDEDIKICENCNRDIPAVNFTIHSVHCARNIRMCPVCKEPVPITELEEHSEKLHKLLPCEKCGEMVCGTDMEDHIRDSCDHTIQSCRWCDLELSRRDLPLHEGYCGTRTEKCAQCDEFVMHKYRQVHLESNHAFIRLDDDPVPRAVRHRPAATRDIVIPSIFYRPANRLPRLLDLQPEENVVTTFPDIVELLGNPFQLDPNIRSQQNESPRDGAGPNPAPGNEGPNLNVQRQQNINLNLLSRNNNAQVNAVGVNRNDLRALPHGAIKKRKAPNPPTAKPPDVKPDVQPQSQAAPGGKTYSLFPPSTSTANTPVSSGPTVGQIPDPFVGSNAAPSNRRTAVTPTSPTNNAARASTNGRIPAAFDGERVAVGRVPMTDQNKQEDFRNVKPMTTDEFMNRFKQLQLGNHSREEESRRTPPEGDRFSAIKSSLKELRRGLNEVTAPYNNNNNISANDRGNPPLENMADSEPDSDDSDYNSEAGVGEDAAGRHVAVAGAEDASYKELMNVKLPCEFCGKSVLALDLVEHETGCRPDLAQLHPEPPREPVDEDVYEQQPATNFQYEDRCRKDANRRRQLD